MPRRRPVVIPPNVWQECRKPHRGSPPRCQGAYEENPCGHPWMVRVSVGSGADGKQKRRASSVPTLDEAAKLAADIAASTPTANGYDPDITVGAWLDAWLLLKERQADALSPSTLPGYRTNIAIWKQDRIARVKVRKVT
ncbi:MAG: hypothetical protein QG597_4713, partial [Actinomycetota bacterium]|nr:hypothetical protein [Actinomycetota bacterium]